VHCRLTTYLAKAPRDLRKGTISFVLAAEDDDLLKSSKAAIFFVTLFIQYRSLCLKIKITTASDASRVTNSC
jgi:hypothetical protein